MKNSSFDKLVENGFISITEKISRQQVLTTLSYASTQKMAVSETFYLKTIRVDSLFEFKRHAKRSMSVGPIIVDLHRSRGTIIDGAHRWLEAKSRGDKTIKAWVGDKALHCLESVVLENTDYCDDFRNHVCRATKIALFTHPHPDPDAIGSMIGVQWLLKKVFKVDAKIFYSGRFDHPQYKAIVDMGFCFLPIEYYVKEDYDLSIICDTVLESSKYDIIIDHHRVHLHNYQGLYIQSEAGSCCSIVCDLIRRFCNKIDPRVAVAMLSGIRDDTQNLTYGVMDIDMESYQFLFDFIDTKLLNQIAFFRQSKDIIDIKIKAYNEVQICNKCAIVGLGVIPEELAYIAPDIANDLSLWEGIDIAICFAINDDKIYGFARSQDKSIPIKSICELLGRSMKSGDGKPGEGSYCHVLNSDEPERLKVLLKIALANYLIF